MQELVRSYRLFPLLLFFPVYPIATSTIYYDCYVLHLAEAARSLA